MSFQKALRADVEFLGSIDGGREVSGAKQSDAISLWPILLSRHKKNTGSMRWGAGPDFRFCHIVTLCPRA
jgi:hypothetical protein